MISRGRTPFEIRLQTRIFITFFIVMTFFVVYAYFRLTKEVKDQFLQYALISRERSIADIVSHLESVYRQDRSWNLHSGQDIVRYAMRNGQVITLMNMNREVIWKMDKWAVGLGLTNNPRQRNRQRSMTEAVEDENYAVTITNNDLEYTEVERALLYDGRTIGYVLVGNYIHTSLNPEGLDARQQLLLKVSGTAFLGLFMATITAMGLARLFSGPLSNLTKAAKAMQSGYLVQNLQDRSGTVEIGELTRAFNYLSYSLNEQRALRKRLTSDISHELRTPLNALLALSEAYIDGVVPVTTESLQTFRHEIIRLASLVSELSKISDLEDDQLKIEKQEFFLGDVLDDLILVYESLSIKSSLQFSHDIDSHIKMYADKDRFKQAVINLLSNAIKYTPAGGEVILSAYQDINGVYIQVKDSGEGIPDDQKEHIFERFYRLEQSRNRNTGGAGLGLTLVKRIIDAHQWRVYVEDNTPCGSIFTIEIPHSNYNSSANHL
ncbi:HAMP domain-containing sensor histidine kinase [Entomospira entomophila]|uniref:histidine kinase n=1 Tax=Entomospira entomophila TaxID=2719988 RepID=A0A968GA71_9SPIO|nr:HAMP domain-containing sensor histidine kinase [Entomospira entomophilus]NIZ40645.1 HAMP domain-containing histidine kinase [Entomospira entomophilus]WDI34859.1 HAMP domain-containing sensor histidine kinase [Entomospira entomophilus]